MPQLASDLLPHHVATALGISANATISSPSHQGMTSEVAFIDDQGRKSVLKRCRDPRYIEWLRREHRVLTALSECRLRIPRALGYAEVRENGQVVDAWLLMTRLPGERLWDVLLNSAASKRSDYLRKLGNLLHELHSTAAPKAFQGQHPWIDRTFEKARKNLPWCDGSPELLAQLEATRPAPVPEVLIHGDLALENVLIDQNPGVPADARFWRSWGENGSLSLIDWPAGDLGDPRSDVALALSTEPELQLSEADVAAFYEGYGGEPMDGVTRRWFVELYEFF